jgi:hypothetical protein
MQRSLYYLPPESRHGGEVGGPASRLLAPRRRSRPATGNGHYPWADGSLPYPLGADTAVRLLLHTL